MDLGIEGRVALVTASSKGLGRASALALAGEGCKLVVCARGEDALRATEKELADRTDVLALVDDVTEPDAPHRLVEATVERFGTVDILVPNAGGPPATRAFEFDDQQLAAALNANLTTSIRLARQSLPHMRANKWGRVCCITSSSVKQPIPTLAMSNVARTALWAWIKTAARARTYSLTLTNPAARAASMRRSRSLRAIRRCSVSVLRSAGCTGRSCSS